MKAKACQKMLAVLLAVSMTGAAAPSAVFAADAGYTPEMAKTADQENGDGFNLPESPPNSESVTSENLISENEENGESDAPETGISNEITSETPKPLENETPNPAAKDMPDNSENGIAGNVTEEEGNQEPCAREVVETYLPLEEGTPQRQTDGRKILYRFQPTASGYYCLSCESGNGQEFYLRAESTYYIQEDENGNSITKEDIHGYQTGSSPGKTDRIMWLNENEQYIFSCEASYYNAINTYDFILTIKAVNITGIETETNPQNVSFDFLDYTGMQVKILFADGTFAMSDVSNYCRINALDWAPAYNSERRIDPSISVVRIDDTEWNQEQDFRALESTNHTATLRISEWSSSAKTYDFQINFTKNDNLYERMEIIPKRTVYYTECSLTSENDTYYSGDYIDGNFNIILYKKDGTTASYNYWWNLPYVSMYGDYGLQLNNASHKYTNIDNFISNGGAEGEQTVEVSYCGMKASFPITLTKNPYTHFVIAEKPDKTQYLHNNQSEYLNLRGLVIHAYKNETDYDIFNYNDYNDYDEYPGSLTEEQYHIMSSWHLFQYTLGGHNSIEYLETGTHPVSVFFMGHEVKYDIEVKDQLLKSLTILQEPTERIYYTNYETELNLQGLEIQTEDLEGNIKKYKSYYNPANGENTDYGNWWDISRYFTYSSNIDWSKTGDYTVSISCLGAEASFEVALLENPVKAVQITKMPDKKTYYQYEDIDLQGMEYQITYKNGETFTGKGEKYETQFTFDGKQFPLIGQWKRVKDWRADLGENAILLSALGVKAETEPITVNEDPVKSLDVVKNPEKLQYISTREKIDLYGMELSISYINGASETVSFTEHTNNLEVQNDCGGTITAGISHGETKTLFIYYRNTSCSITLPPLDLTSYSPAKMTDEGYYPTVLTEEQPYRIYSFRPSETKTYHFFSSGTVDNYVELYKGNKWIDCNDHGSGNANFSLSRELTADTDYYFIVSNLSFGNTGSFVCYFSSTVPTLSDLTVQDMQITKTPKDTWYDFETSTNMWADNLSLENTEYEITYSNNWKRSEKLQSYGQSAEINGITLSVKWEHTITDENGGNYIDTNTDNAILYTYGEKTFRFPVKFNVPGPVKSINVIQHPWENWKPYAYQITEEPWPTGLLSIKIQYKDETEKTIDWKTEENGTSYYHNGYWINANLKTCDNIEAGGDNSIVLSYMGNSAEIPITITENPVQSMQILQKPEKTEYYPFEFSNTQADLYGAKIEITYKDGKTQTVEAAEHGSAITVPDTEGYGGTLSSYFGYNGGEHPNTLFVRYMGCTQDAMSCTVKSFTPENSTLLTENEEKQAILKEGISYQIFSFTPSEAGTYRFGCNTGENDYDNAIRLYNSSGSQLGYTWSSYLDCEMLEGRQYYIALIADTSAEQNLTCTIARQSDVPKENISEVNFSMDTPTAGENLADITNKEYDKYYVSSYQWLNDENNDAIADYGTAHRLMAVLKAKAAYQFTSSTQVIVNNHKVTAKSVGSDGNLTLYYTFPHTQCKITIPQADGYTLDESQNAEQGKTNYGENYTFRYIKNADNASDSRIIVKANDTVLTPNEDGYYVIEKVTENITVTTKQDGLSAGSDESKLTLYNKSSDIFDVLIGKQNAKLADNEGSEKALPSLKSYTDGSDQFFFGWYQDKDTELNGKGTRFTSLSVLVNPLYELYAKWGKGIFSYFLNNKQINCKILSIDEFNKTKVQIGDARNRAAKASSGAASEKNALAGENSGILEIPESIDWSGIEDLKALDIAFSDCKVTAIAENTFAGDNDIKQVKLPETLESIGANAFAECTGLEDISIPASVDTVPEGAFQGCTNLTHVRLNEGVSRIDASAFDGCTSLQTVVLPDTIETVDETAFTTCENFDIICSGAIKESGVITAIQETTGANVVALDIELNYDSDIKQFTYGDPAFTFTASVRVNGETDAEREIIWTYPVTPAYDFQISEDKNSLMVTPKQMTSNADRIVIRATDKTSQKSREILLKTDGIDLGKKDAENQPLFSIKAIPAQKHTGSEIRPEVIVMDNKANVELSKDSYDVSYTNNIQIGTATVTVNGKGGYTGSLSADFEIEKGEGKGTQTITVSANVAKTFGDQPFELGATTNGDGTLSYQSKNPEIATVNDKGLVTILAAGTAEISITASETANYASAAKSITLTVAKATQVIQAENISKTFGDAPFEMKVSTNGGGTLGYQSKNPEIATINDKGLVTILAAGTAEIFITASETANYASAAKSVTLTVAKIAQTIQAADITKVYGDDDFNIVASTSGDGTLSYSVSDPNVISVDSASGTVKIIGAGIADLTIKASETSTYLEASKTIKITIEKATVKISRKSYQKIYGDKPFKLGVSARDSISYATSNKKVATVENGKVTIKACGTAKINVSVKSANYENTTQTITILVVPKKAALKKLTSKKAGQMMVTWKMQKEAAGYVIEYSTDKKFKKGVKTVHINKNKTTSSTIKKKLTKGKKYYVRVKAYTKIGKKKTFGGASKALNVKVKKK